MAHIAYVGLPAHGHTNPTLPVMAELVARGHRVCYFNAESFRTKLAPTGVEFYALPEPLPTEREMSEALEAFINASRMLTDISRLWCLRRPSSPVHSIGREPNRAESTWCYSR